VTGPAPKVFTIPGGVPFVDALAEGIVDRVGADPLALAGVTVLLPTRRACRALREAFLRLAGGRPLLLPRMSPLGDLDDDELVLTAGGLPGLDGALDLPDAIGPLERQLLLARLVLARDDGLVATTAQAARLAADLGRLIDEVWTERAAFDRLTALVPEDFARHWQVTLRFLTLVTDVWPAILEERGAVDPAARRNRVLEAQAAAWTARPPLGPVIAAGDTGSIPATADLLAAVAALPDGSVVLPGLDQDTDEDTWAAVEADPTHPQHGLSRLVRRLGVARADVQPWSNRPDPRAARVRLVAEALRPSATTEAWRGLEGVGADAVEGLTRLDAATPEEEALAIALLMREALETPERRAALVTPDRALARRVTMALRRWGIAVDDSAGRALGDTAVGTYLRLTADFAVRRAHPLAFLALVKHPMAAAGYAPGAFRAMVRLMERAVLRGPRPADGFAGLRAALAAAPQRNFNHPAQRGELGEWLDRLEGIAAPFLALAEQGRAPFAELVEAHARFAENLAAAELMPGPARLWRQDDGVEAARFLDQLLRAAGGFPEVPVSDYLELFNALMGARPVRPSHGLHPRLTILGPIEARLQHFDLMILGGLNEGTWPQAPGADPWMSRPMRLAFGLPSPEQPIGLSAHDFASALGAERVVLTRAAKVDGTPTVPSRWLLRLDAVLRAAGLAKTVEERALPWLDLARRFDRPDAVRPVRAPAPRPPVEARPRRLSVTQVETWVRDPYALYARHILDLNKLEDIAADPGASDRGKIIHAALDAFIRAYPKVLPQNALDELLRLGRAEFGPLLDGQPDVWAFWWPRFERIAEWFVGFERERRAARTFPLATEVTGRLELDCPGGAFTLTAKADRMDIAADGTLHLIDYKTGSPPSAKEIEFGIAPQLPLEAVIAAAGGFAQVDAREVSALSFWRLSGGDPPGEAKEVRGAVADHAERAKIGLIALINAYDDPATPYPSRPRPAFAPRYDDYEHLARVPEWSVSGEGEE
jgi:ATP-dependent helicase/nuclease subunit B